jgi:hypothetical protein
MSEWISTKDKLPDDDQLVLAVFEDFSTWYRYPTSITLLRFKIKSQYDRYFVDKSTLFPVKSETVTHWMPIPEQP